MIDYLGSSCSCGKVHKSVDCRLCMGKGALETTPEVMSGLGGKRPFLLADSNTFAAAGAAVCRVLDRENISRTVYVYKDSPEPDEVSVGAAVMHFDSSCDCIIGIGSGVIHDIGKILSVTTGKPYIIVATAPSMDGYASATSSVIRDGLKVSLNTRHADAIIGDTDILKNAPLHMLKSGIGDMLAKYISIGEWRIGHIITGEYYCERIADLVRQAVKRCVDNAAGLLAREDSAVEAVFEGLIIGGVAMAYAGVSRPASGVEHYISHIWDMRGVAFGTPNALHGISCGVGTLYAARIYDRIRQLTPDKNKALAYVKAFDFAQYANFLRGFVGPGAEAMIAAEQQDGKYDASHHARRLAVILEKWADIQAVIRQEIPPASRIEKLLDMLQAPKSCQDLGLPASEMPAVFAATKDIRDKYVLSRLCFDLGILEEITF